MLAAIFGIVVRVSRRESVYLFFNVSHGSATIFLRDGENCLKIGIFGAFWAAIFTVFYS